MSEKLRECPVCKAPILSATYYSVTNEFAYLCECGYQVIIPYSKKCKCYADFDKLMNTRPVDERVQRLVKVLDKSYDFIQWVGCEESSEGDYRDKLKKEIEDVLKEFEDVK